MNEFAVEFLKAFWLVGVLIFALGTLLGYWIAIKSHQPMMDSVIGSLNRILDMRESEKSE